MNVSLDDVEPEVVLKADLFVVQDWKRIEHDNKRLLGRMFRAGQIAAPNLGKQPEPGVRVVDAEIGEIVRDRMKGRAQAKRHYSSESIWVAIDDVVLGGQIYILAKARVRGEEVDSEILDGPQSIAFRQAPFKLFSAIAILEWCILGGLSFAIDGANRSTQLCQERCLRTSQALLSDKVSLTFERVESLRALRCFRK